MCPDEPAKWIEVSVVTVVETTDAPDHFDLRRSRSALFFLANSPDAHTLIAYAPKWITSLLFCFVTQCSQRRANLLKHQHA